MRLELDHVFVCTSADAPAADAFVRFGLREGPPNTHAGQGTACRRFSFQNAMIELLWVNDAKEAQSKRTRRTLLWERWSRRESGPCPFGICLRPAEPERGELPFAAWEYRPAYLPDPLVMYIGEAGVDEPMWVYMDFMRRASREEHFVGHPNGIREISRLVLTSPVALRSSAAQVAIENGVLAVQEGPQPLLEIEFDGARRKEIRDFRPHLPCFFRF